MTRHLVTTSLSVVAGLLCTARPLHGAHPPPVSPPARRPARRDEPAGSAGIDRHGALALGFEENRGQSDPAAKFVAHAGSTVLWLAPQEIVFAADRAAPVQMRFVGANAAPSMLGVGRLPGQVNYLIGNQPEQWHTHIPTWAQVRYGQLYRGIDLAVYGDRERLEYDLVVAPGAHLEDVRLRFDGAQRIEIDRDGDLIVHTRAGKLRHHKPIIYQETDHGRRPISGGYVRTGTREVGVRVAAFDRHKALTIDPVLDYSTYLGGDGNDSGLAIAADAHGNAYVTGVTRSANFPTVNPLQPQPASSSADAFIAKFDAGGALVFATYLGGTAQENSISTQAGIAVDGDGNVYVTGTTQSTDFPLKNAAQPDPTSGVGSFGLAFVSKLDPSGAALLYSTYLGGTSGASGNGIVVDASGNAYVAGEAGGGGFPTTPGAYQTACTAVPTCNGSTQHGFVTKYDPDGRLVYSTLVGANSIDILRGVAIDPDGNAYLAGETYSDQGFPPGGLQPTFAGGTDAFVAKLDASGSHLTYFTYLGGSGASVTSGADGGYGIAVDADDNVYVVGETFSPDFPVTAGVVQSAPNPNSGATLFLTKLDLSASSLGFSTFLPGCMAYGLALDANRDAYVLGRTNGGCPVTPVQPLQAPGVGSDVGVDDAFVTVVNPAGTALLFSTPLGGSGYERAFGIAVDPSGHIYATGDTRSMDFPTVNPLQPHLQSLFAANAFVAKISPAAQVPAPGDANCDRWVTAADLTALLLLIGNHMPAACPTADANGDDLLNEDDVQAATEALFDAGV